MAETIHDIIERLEGARDRCRNAGDSQGALDAECAIGDLKSLRATALPAALEIEEYFNQRVKARGKKAGMPPGDMVTTDDPGAKRGTLLERKINQLEDDSSDDS